MKEFTPASLQDKTNSHVQKILKIAFEYYLAGVSEAHSLTKKIDSKNLIAEFNSKNELQRTLLLTYPFFISLSNGHGNSLFNLFGNFLTYTYGPASESIKELIPLSEKSNSGTFKYFKINRFNIEITDISIQNFFELKQAIRNSPMWQDRDGQEILFENIKVQNDKADKFTHLYLAIDNGIEILKKRTHNLFFDGSTKRVFDLAILYEAWLKNYNQNVINRIRYENIAPPNNRPIYSE